MDLEKIYKENFSSDDEAKSLGWGSKFSQYKRFEVLLEIKGFILNDSVLDIGCGYGDLSYDLDNYKGIDLRVSAIDKAKEKYKKNFEVKSIFEVTESYDWVLASGIFCFEENWEKITSEHIKIMFSLSKKGIAFNFLSDLTMGTKVKGMKYATIGEVIKIVEPLTKKFTIRHDYLHNDFTFYLYK